MLRFIRVIGVTPSFIIPIMDSSTNEYDNVVKDYKPDKPLTGVERVKKMFQTNEYGEGSVELHSVIQATLFGSFVGACMGGFIKSREAYFYFIETNQATTFTTLRQAQKKLQDHVGLGFFKGAYHWGWRVGMFTGMFSLVSTIIQVYRDETNIVDYVLAGTITGAMYKANLGLAASLVGAGLGAALSFVGGALIVGVMKTTGVTMPDIRQALYKIKEARENQMRQAEEKAATIKNDNFTKHHDMIIQERGVENIDDIK